MKIAHTADWHLGKIIFQTKLLQEQTLLLEDFCRSLEEQQPDVLIIAGDVYDRSVPPSEAVELLDQTLNRIVMDLAIPVLMISGNHDSPERIHFGSSFMRQMGLHVRGKLDGFDHPVTFEDAFGPVDFFLLPYADPAEVKMLLKDESLHTHQAAYEKLIERIKAHQTPGRRTVLITHAFIAGGTESESERPLSVGGSSVVEAGLFKDFTFTALGHLHRPQDIISQKIHYSGSLMKYSFSEALHTKSYSLIELTPDTVTIQKIPLKTKRDLRIIKGHFEEILEKGRTDTNNEDFILAIIEGEKAILNPIEKLRSVYPNIMKIEREAFAYNRNSKLTVKERESKTDMELFQAFFEQVNPENTVFTPEMKTVVDDIFSTLYKEDDHS
ncbi:MAG TPA: exonuclease SbcCD subunit D [Thermotogota bacterium]|nr:exonuclease SbcCD subunit D [Thermotogota bacterium]HRW34798.1 exonuclease SbcCD subunit D [Thermotogota bacterium]